MRKFSKSLICGSFLALICLPPVHAQTAANPPTAGNATAANAAPTGQAPDEVMKKLSDLVHAGKYAEAQQLTTGLLLAYPDDQRLVKAKALLDKSLAAASAKAAVGSNPPTTDAASIPPATNTAANQITGMDKIDYSALVVLARQAQQTDDLSQQKRQLHQFMDQSVVFLQKHPDQALLWQLRAASAISLDEPMAGYEAGQRLLTMGAADSNDANLLQLLGQLKNKGWLDREGAGEQARKYDWILGTWSGHFTESWRGKVFKSSDSSGVECRRSDSGSQVFECWPPTAHTHPVITVTILDSGEIRCDCKVSDNNGTMTLVWTYPYTHNYKADGFATVTQSYHKMTARTEILPGVLPAN